MYESNTECESGGIGSAKESRSNLKKKKKKNKQKNSVMKQSKGINGDQNTHTHTHTHTQKKKKKKKKNRKSKTPTTYIDTLRKHAYSNILKILQPKTGKFSDKKNSNVFYISAQNIDCGYSLEPPRRGGSNGYPQCMF